MLVGINSLSYAMRKSEGLDISNIEYAQADIMELGDLGRQFDLIESVGVLHHLGDPLAGWRILVDLLRPGGLMRIGLYSEIARQPLRCGRSMIAEKGYTASAEDIRQCRQDIFAEAEDGNSEMLNICSSSDFYSMSECRDLLFHVQEHLFSLPEIEQALEHLNLAFLGFQMQDQTTLMKFRASYADKDAMNSITQWHQFEIEHPNSFAGMYQFWCQKT